MTIYYSIGIDDILTTFYRWCEDLVNNSITIVVIIIIDPR